jgi:hypothetical protein
MKQIMKSEPGKIATFLGTYHVLKAERTLKKEGIEVELIAAPRHISTDCGICIRFGRVDEDQLKAILTNASLEITGIYDE